MLPLNKYLREAAAKLETAGVENAANEAKWMLEAAAGIQAGRLIYSDTVLSPAAEEKFASFIEERCTGRPVQYILGEWDFYGRTFSVGEGVLIPRPETELLVDFALDYLGGGTGQVVYDLCAGSGCIGLTVAAECPGSRVFLAEKSQDAFAYLRRNAQRIAPDAVLLECDVLAGAPEDTGEINLLLSNPPYIPEAEIPSLQREVGFEPAMALDGGKDGLEFYRAICEKWLPRVANGGLVAFECAEDQTGAVASLLTPFCTDIREYTDYASLPRGVTAIVEK